MWGLGLALGEGQVEEANSQWGQRCKGRDRRMRPPCTQENRQWKLDLALSEDAESGIPKSEGQQI